MKEEEKRKCSVCGAEMDEGFVVDDWTETNYFCSEKCLYSKYSEEQYAELYLNDTAYWTARDDDELSECCSE